jgi:hypothetical protein
MARRYFTLDEAQTLVPQLAEILARSVQLQRLLRERADGLAMAGYVVNEALLSGEDQPAKPGDDLLLAETRGLYAALVEDARRVEALGGELKGPDLVDFWSWDDGQREVLLCWRLGERRIAWFHAPEAGFSGRQSVAGHRFTVAREN